MNRPPIPSEIRRKVLTEAGHRCAIPHCLSTELDVHHIVPWETCKEHSAENLIALCPNCHRRSHKGEIDRKSLVIYKLRCQKIFHGEDLKQITSIEPWINKTFHEVQENYLQYDAQMEYPFFASNEFPWADEVNCRIQSTVLSAVQGMRNLENSAPWTWIKEIGEYPGMSSIASSYEIILFEPPFLSIRHTFWSYFYGAAHPNHWTRVSNFYLDPVYDLELRHFFEYGKYLEELSFTVRSKLATVQTEAEVKLNDEWVERGTAPDKNNFTKFNFTKSSLLITYDEYEIGPYAAGRQDIEIPYAELKQICIPKEFQET